jgi:hypothetical protein
MTAETNGLGSDDLGKVDLLRACRTLARLVHLDNNGPLDEIAMLDDNDATDDDLAALRRVMPSL